eukprot:7983515-Heterocapsa_arctica.AAC.1
MFNTPSDASSQGGDSEYSLHSPIADTRREDRLRRLQDSYSDLDQAEIGIARQKSIANAEMAKQ